MLRAVPLSRLFARRERRSVDGTRRTKLRWVLGTAGALVVLLLVAVVDIALHGDEVLRNVSVAGVGIGGKSEDDLRATLNDLEPRLERLPVELVSGDEVLTTTAGEAGLRIDVDATVDDAMDTGRDGLLSPFSWFGGLAGDREAPLRMQVEDSLLEATLQPFGSTGDDPVRFEVRDGAIVTEGGLGRTTVDIDAARTELLASAARGDDPIRAELVITETPAQLTPEEMATIAAEANEDTADGITLTLGEATVPVDAETLRSWLRPDVDELTYVVDADAAKAGARLLFPGSGAEGNDAQIVVFANSPVIVGGDADTTCCATDTGARVEAALRAGRNAATLELEAIPRARGKEWAAGLGITELVGEFTTRYPAGQPRVVNIKRISELTQGALVEPGQTFSINDYVGKRTTENGFVPAGSIQNGVFEDAVGGGISQYATTLFNAAFFAGLDFGEYQSHSIYITRYPYGREATVSFPQPDLQIVNTTPYGILIWPTATDTSVTVQLFSTRFATGEQTGQSQRPQGAACTRVTTERTRTYVDGRPPVIDSVIALYRPEGVACSGNPTRPTTLPPPTTPPPPPPETTLPPVTEPPTTPPPDTTPTTVVG